MSSIGDSSSVLLIGKLLPQHQTAISLIVGQLESPQITDFSWFDLCCGKGQILHQLKGNISAKNVAKIHFKAYDINNEDIRINEQLGKSVGFKSYDSKVGEINDFPTLIPETEKKDFITCLNSFHEIDPLLIPEILLESLIRLNPGGVLFIYDMEDLVDQELGAVTWNRTEIFEVLNCLMTAIDVTDYSPEPQGWPHAKTTGWSIQIHRNSISKSLSFTKEQKTKIIEELKKLILEILERKKTLAIEALESLTDSNSDTKSEEGLQVKFLYDFWAINRILLKHKK
jgi:ubiquinone/menaquinone biosynthesis C-methylase UbiE